MVDHLDVPKQWVESFLADESLVTEEFVPKMFFVDSSGKARCAFFPDLNPEVAHKMVWAVEVIACSIVDLKMIVFVNDMYGAIAPKKDGSDWKEGDMKYAVQNHTEDAPSVVEALNVVGVSEGNVGWATTVEYQRRAHKDHDEIITGEWEVNHVTDFPELSLLTVFTEAMNHDKIISSAAAAIPELYNELGEARANLHALIAAVKTVGKETQCPVAIGTEDPEEASIIQKSLEAGEFRVDSFFEGERQDPPHE